MLIDTVVTVTQYIYIEDLQFMNLPVVKLDLTQTTSFSFLILTF